MPPDENTDDKGKGDISAESLKGLNEAIAGLPEGIQDSVSKGVQAAMAKAAKEVADRKALEDQDDDDDDDDTAGDDDLEKMDRGQFANFIVGRLKKEVGKDFKELTRSNQETRLDAAKDKLQRQLAKLKDDHPDFLEYKDDIARIAETHPDLSPEDLYTLAKAKNPAKREELEKKSAEEKKKKEAEEHKEQRARFAGFTPTSGSSGDKTGKMSQKDAAGSAWDETMASLPKELIGGG